MEFLGIGGWEILLILVVAMIVWGPRRIGEVGRTLGKYARNFKKATFDLTSQVTQELEEPEKPPPPPPETGQQS